MSRFAMKSQVWLKLARTLIIAMIGCSLAPAALTQSELSELGDDLLVDTDAVLAAARFEQPVSDAAAYVSVVTAKMIDEFGYRNIGEVLAAEAGFSLTDDGTRTYIGSRGYSPLGNFNSRILFMVNGQRLNDGVYDAWFSGSKSAIDIRQIDYIEIVRGPGATTFGSNALLAAINVVTKSGRARDGMEAFISVDNIARKDASLSYGLRLDNGVEFDASVRALRDDGPDSFYFPFFDNAPISDGTTDGLRSRNGESVLLTASWQDFSLQYGHNQFEIQTPSAPYNLIFNDPGVLVTDRNRFAQLEWHHIFSNDLDLRFRVHQELHDSQFLAPQQVGIPGLPPFRIVVNTTIDARTRTSSIDLKKSIGIHTLSSGIGVTRKTPLNADLNAEPVFRRMSEGSSSHNAFYLQDELLIADRTRVIGGLRVDNFDRQPTETSPRVALIQQITDHTTLKFIAASAIRAPNWYERSNSFSLPFDNSLLSSEEVRTSEIILTSTKALYTWHISAFHYDYDNLITSVVDPVSRLPAFFNDQRGARASGIEISGGATLGATHVDANVSYQSSEIDTTDQRIENSPKLLANLRLSNITLRENLRLAMHLQFVGNSLTYQREHVGGALRCDASLLWEPTGTSDLTVALRLRNLTDKRYEQPIADFHRQDRIEGDARSVAVDIIWRP